MAKNEDHLLSAHAFGKLVNSFRAQCMKDLKEMLMNEQK
jgi:hypothetical protein